MRMGCCFHGTPAKDFTSFLTITPRQIRSLVSKSVNLGKSKVKSDCKTAKTFQDLVGSVPANPTEKEVEVIKQKLMDEFSDVFTLDTELNIMKGQAPMKIHLKPDAKPFALYSARQIPLAQRLEVKKEIDKMLKLGIIEPLGDEPSQWCHPLVVVDKKKRLSQDYCGPDEAKQPSGTSFLPHTCGEGHGLWHSEPNEILLNSGCS